VNELLVRTLTGVVLIGIALVAAVVGGDVFAYFVAAVATAMFYEWTRIVRGWGAGWYALGFLYALLPALALLWIREHDVHRPMLLFWTLLVTWSTDSPGKTVEGLYGGIAAAALVGGAWVLVTGLGRPLLILAPIFAVAAQGGDLFESGMKRRAGVKDSGGWLPGHGGVLDRLDGLVPVAVLTAVAQLVGLT
jgi:phosphatidate cytidylyltransferase